MKLYSTTDMPHDSRFGWEMRIRTSSSRCMVRRAYRTMRSAGITRQNARHTVLDLLSLPAIPVSMRDEVTA
jgi:hypothetical protein